MNKANDIIISHLYRQSGNKGWIVQTNDEHSRGVAELAAEFCGEFGARRWGALVGLMHDRGKESRDFQNYIRIASGYDTDMKTYNDKGHSHVGAIIVERKFKDPAHTMGNTIAGHHRGLYDHDELEKILHKDIPGEVDPTLPDILPERLSFFREASDIAHFTRMLFSCLTDADYLDTERFMKPGDFAVRANKTDMHSLKSRLDEWLSCFDNAPDTAVNRLRAKVQESCSEKGALPPGFYTLTVPTGGGKTIASMIWALNHAIANGKKRIVIAIPYTSIIIQTAEILRGIFGEENVLEHHSIVDENDITNKNKLATENWDAPIVVTTNVQLFESMFANRPGKCRKLHSLCNSIIILDEAQSLPLSFMQATVSVLESYVRLFGVSVLFSTASQPVVAGEWKGLGKAVLHGLKSEPQELAPAGLTLHNRFRRVSIKMPKAEKAIAEIAEELMACDRVLCVVNTRKVAFEIFNQLPRDESANIHLSRMMCPMHVHDALERVKERLRSSDNRPIRVVSTQLIEAGVDIDFPVVYRQLAGLDSILQAAGRCNREGKREEGIAHVFEISGFKAIGMMANAIYAMKQMLSLDPEREWLSPEAIQDYFRILYSKTASFDKENISGLQSNPRAIAFETIAEKFKLIDDTGRTVIVNYGAAAELVEKLRQYGPSHNLIRQLGHYSVSIRDTLFRDMRKAGLVDEPWEGFFYIPLKAQYDEMTGLRVDNKYIEQTFVI